ncbi:hypothetical protein L596_030279 [Steinernema carpocapsae]|uniref:CHK kinase-like domain-containing protein n=1 Tax=Steinernema carpocapsae TaxID=34508 RepID=A0A4U5LNX4_STECR|nr:hypothetical protein L596_030279 [Steinernema carpocapsae]
MIKIVISKGGNRRSGRRKRPSFAGLREPNPLQGLLPVSAVIVKIPQVFEDDVFGDPDVQTCTFTKAHLSTNHNRECEFYRDFAPRLRIPLGKVFRADKWILGEERGAIVMESFIGRAKSGCFFEGFTVDQLYALAGHLAEFNVNFLTAEDKSWVEKYPNAMWDQMDVVNHFITPMIERLKALDSDEFRDHLKQIDHLIYDPEFHRFTSSGVQEALQMPAVLCHGDMWTNNILWTTTAEGAPSAALAAIIDWQIIHKNTPAFDFARLLTIGTSGDIRRLHKDKILEFYYSILKQKMASRGHELPFSLNRLKEAYDVHFINQTLHLLSFVCFFDEVGSCDQSKREWNSHNYRLAKRAKMAVEDAVGLLDKVHVPGVK